MPAKTTKKVVFFITNNLNVGGVQCRLLDLLPLLTDEHDVHLIVYKDLGVLVPKFEAAGIKLHFIRMRGKWDLIGLYKMSRLLKRYKAQIVHGQSLGGNIAATIAGALAHTPVRIGHVHGFKHWYGKTKFRRKKQIWQETLLHRLFGSHICCVSQESTEYFLDETGLPGDFVSLMYNGIPFPAKNLEPLENIRFKYNISPEAIVIGFVGRIAEGKGLGFLTEAAPPISQLLQECSERQNATL